METVIGLLFLILPAVFSLIGKRLEKAAGTKPWQVQEPGQMPVPEQVPLPEPMPAIKPLQPKPQPQPVQVPRHQPVRKTVKVKEEEVVPEKKKSVIDPKNLVIYSEIMKPKFLD